MTTSVANPLICLSWDSLESGRVHARTRPWKRTRPIRVVYMCTRPCTWPCIGIRPAYTPVYLACTRPCIRFCTREHDPYVAVETARVHPCTRPSTGRVHGRISIRHVFITIRVHGRVHDLQRPCTGRVQVYTTMYMAVYRPCTRHCRVYDRVRAVYTKHQLSNRLIVT